MGKKLSTWTPPAEDEIVSEQKPVMKAWTPPAEDEVVETSKKKEPTTAETSSNDGTIKATSPVSQEPGTKEKQPFERNSKGVDAVLSKNSDKEWVQRLYDPKGPSIVLPGETEPSTHYMESADNIAYPTIIKDKDGNLKYLGKDAYDYAIKNKTYIEFPSDEDAQWFAANGYKQGSKVAVGKPSQKSGEEDKAYQQLLEDTEKGNYGLKKPFVEELKKAPAPLMLKQDAEKNARKVVSDFQKEITGKPESQGLVTDAYLAATNIPGSLNQAFVSGMAAMPKTVAVLAQKLDQLTGAPEKSIEEYATYQLGDYVENKARELGITTLQNPDQAGFMTSTVPQAVGSMLSMMLLGGRGAATNPFAAPQGVAKEAVTTLTSKTAMVGAMQAAVPEFEAAKAAGKTDEEAFNVFLQNIPGGLTESVQMANMFGRLNRMTNNGLMNAIKLSTANGLEEASQEAIQQYLTNKVAQGTYDPERDLKEGIGEGAGAGFIVGFLMPGVMAAMGKMSPDQQKQTKAVLQQMLERGYYVRTPEGFLGANKTPSQVITEAKSPVKSSDDANAVSQAADKILNEGTTAIQSTQQPVVPAATGQAQQGTEAPIQQGAATVGQGETEATASVLETTGEPLSQPVAESKSPQAPVEEAQVGSQGATGEIVSEPQLTAGDNYQMVDNRWQVKQSDGTWVDLIGSGTTKQTQNKELTELRTLKTELEKEDLGEPVTTKSERVRITDLPRNTIMGRVRGFFFDGGKVNTENAKRETGIKDSELQGLKDYTSKKQGLTVEQIAEQLASKYGEDTDLDASDYRQAVIDLLAQEAPAQWYANQRRDEDDDFINSRGQRYDELNRISGRIAELETEEEITQQQLKEQYENERRVYPRAAGAGSQQAEGTSASQQGRSREEAQVSRSPEEIIRENGNEDQSKQAVEELGKLNLTRVSGLGMGQNQAKGTYVSTQPENRYADRGEPQKVRVKIKNPFVVSNENIFDDIRRALIGKRFGKKQIEDLTDSEMDLLAAMMTEHFVNEGYDAIYWPYTETQEGELVVFDRKNVDFRMFPEEVGRAIELARTIKEATTRSERTEAKREYSQVDKALRNIIDNIAYIHSQLGKEITKIGECP